ncbi:zinc-dependent metalloprotease [Leucobacter sp. cx-42]|uniref:zinc-dependent metalloprotease n=1 Tax=unclassified Leucobacter TaxID=2621730 RepID=UPI00165E6983|nr:MULTISPECIES: zinc-dependent metalloprotease [unclassified Leucobacter]MBC9955219.1 zinc-dependent metalloprotease [Leucobacter sp. cx-42]
MGADDFDRSGSNDDFEELQRMLRDMLSGQGMPEGGFDPEKFAGAAGLPGDPAALKKMFETLRGAMNNSADGVDWSLARKSAIEAAGGTQAADPAPAERAFPVASLWLDEVTTLGTTQDAPRTVSRIEWVQQTIDTWISLAEPVAESISDALLGALESQVPEEMRAGILSQAGPMLRNVGGALFAMQLGSIVGRISGEVVSAGDVGIPLFSGAGKEGGALLPSGVAAFADGLDQDLEAVTLYLAVRELAHARLFRHTKWLRLSLLTAITDYAREIRIDTERMEELARDFDPSQTEEFQALLTSGALIPPKTPEQEAAHARLETTLALIDGWVDVVTEQATKRLPGANAIAEMVRRRRAAGGPAERAFSALAGLELRPRRMREAAAMWRLVEEHSDAAIRDGLWSHPDLLPTGDEVDDPQALLVRLGLTDAEPEIDSFDADLARLLSGDLPPLKRDEDDSDGAAEGNDQPNA